MPSAWKAHLPNSPGFWKPWLLAVVLYAVAAVLGLQKVELLVSSPNEDLRFTLAKIAGILALSLVVLWLHAKPAFLTWRGARRFVLTLWVVSLILLPVIWGLIRVMQGRTEFTVSEAEVRSTAQNYLQGLGIFMLLLGVPLVWKLEDNGASALRQSRRNAIHGLRSIALNKVAEAEWGAIAPALSKVYSEAASVSPRLRGIDAAIAASWAAVAKDAAVTIGGMAFADRHHIDAHKMKDYLSELSRDA
jgi:hypothetical protein